MNKNVAVTICLTIALLCLPMVGSAEIRALTDNEMGQITGQKGVALLMGDSDQTFIEPLMVASNTEGAVNPFDEIGFFTLVQNGTEPPTTSLPLNSIIGEEETVTFAMSSLTMATSTIPLLNGLSFGLFGLGGMLGAFEVAVGDVSFQLSGNINVVFHP